MGTVAVEDPASGLQDAEVLGFLLTDKFSRRREESVLNAPLLSVALALVGNEEEVKERKFLLTSASTGGSPVGYLISS